MYGSGHDNSMNRNVVEHDSWSHSKVPWSLFFAGRFKLAFNYFRWISMENGGGVFLCSIPIGPYWALLGTLFFKVGDCRDSAIFAFLGSIP